MPENSGWPMVVLRHEVPDGSAHFDLLLDTAAAEAGPLMTFRCHRRPDVPQAAPWLAERLPPHRRVYLTYEGPVSGDRGRVSRVASGRAVVDAGGVDAQELTLRLITPSGVVLVRGRRLDAACWRFTSETAGDR
ncbi:MAG: hypothetical protein AAGF47_11895 [Planctomycetota bacterium]